MVARETFPQARREAGTTHFRLPADTVGRGTVAQEVSGFVYAQPEHFVAETCPMPAARIPARNSMV